MGACLSSSTSPAGSDAYRLGDSRAESGGPTPHAATALVRKLPALHGDIVFAVAGAAAADDSFFSACADGSIRHYDWLSGRVLRAYRHDKSVHRLHHTPASGFLFSGARDTTVRQWRVPDTATPTPGGGGGGGRGGGGDDDDEADDVAAPVQVFRGHDLVVTGLATSAGAASMRCSAFVFILKFMVILPPRHLESFSSNPDSRTLATGSRDYNVCFWDVPTGAKTAVANINQNMVTALKWVPGEANLVLQTSEDLKMRIWSRCGGDRADAPLTIILSHARSFVVRIRLVPACQHGRLGRTGFPAHSVFSARRRRVGRRAPRVCLVQWL
jgi:hypothetical protein